MEPIDYGGALRRSWRLLVGLAIVGAIIAAFVPVAHAKRVKAPLPYEAVAVVGTPPQGGGSPLNGSVTNAQILFEANASTTLQQVADDAGISIPAYALPAYMVASAVAAKGTGLGGPIRRNSPTNVQLIAFGATAEDAVLLANQYSQTLGDVMTEKATEKQAQNPKSGGGTVATGYTVLHPALDATKVGAGVKASLGASRKVRVGAGLAIGAGIGAAIVLLRELLDKRLRNAARAEANFGFPVVVEIPTAVLGASPAAALAPMVDVIREPDSPGAEAYRMLRMSVMLEGLAPTSGPTDPYAMGMDGGLGGLLPPQTKTADGPARELHDRHVVLVVSPGSEPTRPHVAANLAAIYAEAGQRVVVVSTGEVEARLKGSSRVSVNGDISTEDVEAQLQPSRLEHVSRLPLSPFISRSGELVTRGPAILDAARALSDVIIVEVPPLLAVHHAEALVHSVDVVLVVAECRVTTFDQARRAGDLLRRMGAPVLGVVLTNVRIERADIRHSALTPPSVTETETAGGEEAVLALSAGGGSTSGSTTRTQA
ncbi:MAG TPA: hypothetical protein VIC86_06990 [Acidimicrobiales bacterium]|jgi:Mrp family chromosome partitioning ATPase